MSVHIVRSDPCCCTDGLTVSAAGSVHTADWSSVDCSTCLFWRGTRTGRTSKTIPQWNMPAPQAMIMAGGSINTTDCIEYSTFDQFEHVPSKTIYDDRGGGTLSLLPGCSGVVVSHSASVNKEHRRKGVGDMLHKERIKVAQEEGAGLMMCTVEVDNVAEEKILVNNDWFRVHIFTNPKTNHMVGLWLRNMHGERV